MRLIPLVLFFWTLPVAAESFGEYRSSFTRSMEVYHPDSNPNTPAKVELGRALFFDPRLSGTNTLSCASCHNPALGFSDGLPTALGKGGKALLRRTPALWNVAFAPSLHWDNKFQTLEEQALAPISNPDEMHMNLKRLPRKLEAIKGYQKLFTAAFPGEKISAENVARALAVFQRTLTSSPSNYDLWASGQDTAMSLDAKNGLLLFVGKARCVACHVGATLTDFAAHDIGLKNTKDGGVGALRKIKEARFKFKTPSLVNVTRHPPYMHDGSLKTLEEVIDFYDRGGDAQRPTLSTDIQKLNLTPLEKGQILAFLKALESREQTLPEVPQLPE